MTRRPGAPSYDPRVDPATLLARVPPRPTRTDVVLVAALLAWAVAEHVMLNGASGLLPGVLFALGVTVPLAWRRQQPLVVLAVLSVAVLARGLTAPEGQYGAAPFPSLLVLTFSLALHVRPLAPAAAAGLVPALLMITLSWQGYYGPFDGASVLILSFFVGGAWALGRTVLRAAHQLSTEQARSVETTRQALEDERARIARELHDVVAHAVSIVVVQAGAAEALVDRNPAAAKEHLRAVRRTGREALAEMRHLLQVLREGEATYVPQPRLAGLADLVDEVGRTGTPVTLELADDLGELPVGLELCAYRVVQEALTNVRKHAPGAATTVRITRHDDDLAIRVANTRGDSPAPALDGPGGNGLTGMTERVRLYGGRLEAQPDGDGFVVTAQIPLGVPA
jgi:signal transduction histidine kinase